MPPLLQINGRSHISAHQAARQAGLSSDHICKLAGRGTLVGRVLAGAWYLEQESVRSFIAQRAKNGSTKP
jgi:hypothetical protein